MKKFSKRVLSILFACVLSLGVLVVGAGAADNKLDTQNAAYVSVWTGKIISPVGKEFILTSGAELLEFSVPWSGNWAISSSSWGSYPTYDKAGDIVEQYTGIKNTGVIFGLFSFVFNFRTNLTRFLWEAFVNGVLPHTDPAMELYDANGKLIGKADNEGFPLLKTQENDYRFRVRLESGKKYYIRHTTEKTTFDFPYYISIRPAPIV
jgi:hypothetical protein